MQSLIQQSNQVIENHRVNNIVPHFAVITSNAEQHIRNIPITQPLLVLILQGNKCVGQSDDFCFTQGNFIFFANTPTIDMRNIPENNQYFALMISFDISDFNVLTEKTKQSTGNQANAIVENRMSSGTLILGTRVSKELISGNINDELIFWLKDFIQLPNTMPKQIMSHRKQELLLFLYYQGVTNLVGLVRHHNLSKRIQALIQDDINANWDIVTLAEQLHMSESTIRRKLAAENTNITTLRKHTKLSQGLHLVQTTKLAIGEIASDCGYVSQSRFTADFKALFGVTPTELRLTKS